MIANLFYAAIGVFAGIYVGAIPGLSVTMATSLLITMTYSWDTNAALALMMGVYVGGVYGGSRSAILLNIPGAPAAVATAFDGYPLAQRGEAGKAIAVSTIMSVLGGMVGLIILWVAAPLVSNISLQFGPKEYFLIALMGMLLVGGMGGKSLSRGLLSAGIGMMLGVVGMDAITGEGRFTFGSVNLRGGIDYIAVMIGLFGIGQALFQIPTRNRPVLKQKVDKIRPSRSILLKYLPLCIRSSLIGTFVGALPGAGGDIAAILAYNAAKQTCKHTEVPMGEGAYEGVVAPESANNAAIGGALIPMLTLGIPGDSVTAILIGALSIHGIRAGPMVMFTSPELFTTISLLLLISNLFLLVFGLTGIRIFIKLVDIPQSILIPMILVISVIGSYSISNNMFDVACALIFGVVGYFMKCYDFPVAPLVLGLILCPTIEVNLRRAITSSGGLYGMLCDIVRGRISLILLIVLCISILAQIFGGRRQVEKQSVSQKAAQD